MSRLTHVSLFVLAGLAGASAGALVDGSPHAAARSRHELVALANELARRHTQVERGDGTRRAEAEAAEDDVSREGPALDELIEHEREIAERRAAVITAAAERETLDPSWSAAAEHRIAEGLAAHGPPGVALVSSTCKTTLCIVELVHPPGDPGTEHVNWLPVFGLPRGFFVRHPPQPGRHARTMAYLARKGYSLPLAESNRRGPERWLVQGINWSRKERR
ncbi:hypothetical protein [Paraliomyxa miuraensis]|uniref:hypothetical protein n=1 Tax=Paraliomyxa miuraensis TaxID=376150 RepID=UPI00224E5176|nr:hypothetical protein [Paraliomyxa miuraensis]MCX4243915.1 hypothetical protein [Paraliomyxa miuraensis]